ALFTPEGPPARGFAAGMSSIVRGEPGMTAIDAQPPGFDVDWSRLSAEVGACRRCRLGSLRVRPAFYRGVARPLAVFVGEAPGAEEDGQGLPLAGRAGSRLTEGLARIGVVPGETGFVNLLK